MVSSPSNLTMLQIYANMDSFRFASLAKCKSSLKRWRQFCELRDTAVVGDVEVYPGDVRLTVAIVEWRSLDLEPVSRPPKVIEEEISRFFSDRAFGLATMVACLKLVTYVTQAYICILRYVGSL